MPAPTRLDSSKILMNLVGNAIKFTPENWPDRIGRASGGGQVRLEVRIMARELPRRTARIFEAFFRLTQTGNTTEGTGLGLAITARLVELHGSKLEIESKPGKGTCFHFPCPPGDGSGRTCPDDYCQI